MRRGGLTARRDQAPGDRAANALLRCPFLAEDSFDKAVCLARSLSPLSPATQSCATGDFLKVYERPRIGGDLCNGSFSETASLQSSRRFCAFFSGPEIPFPGNGDRERQDPVFHRAVI